MNATIFEVVDAAVRRYAQKYFMLCLVAMVLFTLLYYGLGVVPREFYRELATNPYIQRTDIHRQNYFQESPLLPVLAHLTGLGSRWAFNAFCFTFLAVGFVFLMRASRRRYGAFWALLLLGALLAHPVTLVLLSWLGMPDSMTFLITALLLYTRRSWVMVVLVLLGSYNHPIMMFVAPAVLGLRLLARENGLAYRHLAFVVLGAVGGWLAVRFFLHVNSIAVVSRAAYMGDQNLAFWIKYNLTHLPLALFSFHNVIWFALGACLLVLARFDKRYVLAFLTLQFLFYGITFFCLDTTRVFALLAWAPAWHCLVYALQRTEAASFALRRQLERLLVVVVMMGLLAPTYYSYLGELYFPGQNEIHFWSWIKSRP
ncbi:MAG: hypothetical protein EPN23_05580 [Verrucomicrobia bacterium]|nr:MAG: hypothetical protein EPN23_05580 [Verrucomicrobiota bacterium]